jgi:outer membrane protein assembly factor BamB
LDTPNSAVGRTRSARWLIVVLIAVVALVGCGRNVPPYWPEVGTGPDRLYVAETNGQVFALEPETGDVLWTYPQIQASGGGFLSGCTGRAPSDGPFYAAPAVGSELVFLSSAGEATTSLFRRSENTAGLRALNTLGTLQWSFKGTETRAVASPILSDGTVYLASSDHSVYAIDIDTREPRWAFETGSWVWANPVVSADMVYVASMDHLLYAIDAASGNEVWRFSHATSALPAAPALVEGVLYLGSLNGGVYAVDAATGDLIWSAQTSGGMWATPQVAEGIVHFGTLGGIVYALDTEDGTTVWEQAVGGEVRGTPAYVDGIVYFGCEDGRLYAFDALDGTEQVSPLGETLENASIFSSPVYDGQRLYVVATNAEVFALDLERNVMVWRRNPLEVDEEGG